MNPIIHNTSSFCLLTSFAFYYSIEDLLIQHFIVLTRRISKNFCVSAAFSDLRQKKRKREDPCEESPRWVVFLFTAFTVKRLAEQRL